MLWSEKTVPRIPVKGVEQSVHHPSHIARLSRLATLPSSKQTLHLRGSLNGWIVLAIENGHRWMLATPESLNVSGCEIARDIHVVDVADISRVLYRWVVDTRVWSDRAGFKEECAVFTHTLNVIATVHSISLLHSGL